MEKLKFRVWHKQYKEYHDVLFIDLQHNLVSIHNSNSAGTFDPSELIIEQTLGIEDYNGVAIFEGDILEMQSFDPFFLEPTNSYKALVAVRGGHKGLDIYDYMSNGYSYRVIGNINQNPELVEIIGKWYNESKADKKDEKKKSI